MSPAKKHNEFIKDTEDLIFNKILPYVSQDDYRTILSNWYSSYKKKWKNTFALKKEDTIEETNNKEQRKIEKLYINLKNSIKYATDLASNDVESSSWSVDSAMERLQKLLESERSLQCGLQDTQYQKGCILVQLERLTTSKKAFTLVLGNMMSYGHAKKLIRFYNMCEKYILLRYTTLPFRHIIKNMKELKHLMEKEVTFWSPPHQPKIPEASH